MKKIVRLKIKKSLAKLSNTLVLKDFSDQKKSIKAAIYEIVNRELNSVGLSNHNILWLELRNLDYTIEKWALNIIKN